MATIKKSVLITGGGAGGIGDALAREFHRRGLRVFATARKVADLEELTILGIETLVLDVLSPEAIETVQKEIALRNGGKLDILINNAGKTYEVAAIEFDFDEVQTLFETNLFSIMRMVKEFSSLLIKSKGTIVSIGTLEPNMPFPFRSSYNVTKGAL